MWYNEYIFREMEGKRMKLVSYEINHRVRTGVLSADEKWIYPTEAAGV